MACSRFASAVPFDELRRTFGTLGHAPDLPPSWNVAPAQTALVVRRDFETSRRRLDAMTWRLIPPRRISVVGVVNSSERRSDAISNSGSRLSVREARRCLVPINAFYHWEETLTGKQPWAIGRADEAPLALAGLWKIWRAPNGAITRTFTIATTSANRFMRRFHAHMPVILDPDTWPVWLGEKPGDAALLIRPVGENVLKSWAVSCDLNSPRCNRPDLLAPIEPVSGRPVHQTKRDRPELPVTPVDRARAVS